MRCIRMLDTATVRLRIRRVFGHNPNSTVNVGINPRSDGIAVGNMMERGNGSLDVNEEVRKQNMEAAMTYFSAMRRPITARPQSHS